MHVIKQVCKYIERHPQQADAKTLAQMALALEAEGAFGIVRLYALERRHLRWALQVLQAWPLDGHYASKACLLDLALQVNRQAAPAPAKRRKPTAGKSAKKP